MQIRKNNEEDRNCLKKAKRWFENNVALNPKHYRDRITKIKKLIKAGKPLKVEAFNSI